MTKTKKELPVVKNDKVWLTIEDMTHDGRGVGKVDFYPIFVENAIVGEEVEVRVLKTTKKFAYGKVLQWKKKSENRVEDVDADLIRTGIAPLAHMSYEAQLEFKKEQVKKAVTRIGGFDDVEVKETIGMETPFKYRNKAQIPVRKINERLELGFFRRNSHDLIPIEDFYIQETAIDEALLAIKPILEQYNVKPYDEEKQTGHLRNIVIRKGHYTDELMIVLVTKKKKLFKIGEICKEIVAAVPNVKSIMQSIHTENNNVILGKEFVRLYGTEYIEDQLLGNTYQISASSFYQINTTQAEVLYQEAIDRAELSKEDVVIDAYCGIGTIGLSLAKEVKKVYGVEVVEEAIMDAKKNAEINGIENVEFEVGKAEFVFDKWLKEGLKPTVILVDPPRKGLTESFIKSSAEMNPEKIVYVSCDPATFARDLKLYGELGYTPDYVQPVDMFPQTSHVECVTVLKK
ncbi:MULTISPECIES: 23S rRNA (uracil(1939)-C(5))-methyltransferase RlmD [Vagococcus]|uniref:23S rRNA (uracil(1939)-C(5))-methyltransferase RlmD n=1 Tax=Vagococcus TaxID=2737 RepID=UPI002FC5FA2E